MPVGILKVVIGVAAVPMAWPIMLRLPPDKLISVLLPCVLVLRMFALMLAVPPLTLNAAVAVPPDAFVRLVIVNTLLTLSTPVAVLFGAEPPSVKVPAMPLGAEPLVSLARSSVATLNVPVSKVMLPAVVPAVAPAMLPIVIEPALTLAV